MKVAQVVSSLLLAGVSACVVPSVVFAIGGPSGPKQTYKKMGQLGEVVVNPYGIAPLTAIIKHGGYTLTDVKVTVQG